MARGGAGGAVLHLCAGERVSATTESAWWCHLSFFLFFFRLHSSSSFFSFSRIINRSRGAQVSARPLRARGGRAAGAGGGARERPAGRAGVQGKEGTGENRFTVRIIILMRRKEGKRELWAVLEYKAKREQVSHRYFLPSEWIFISTTLFLCRKKKEHFFLLFSAGLTTMLTFQSGNTPNHRSRPS
jgi:hypothetical protein